MTNRLLQVGDGGWYSRWPCISVCDHAGVPVFLLSFQSWNYCLHFSFVTCSYNMSVLMLTSVSMIKYISILDYSFNVTATVVSFDPKPWPYLIPRQLSNRGNWAFQCACGVSLQSFLHGYRATPIHTNLHRVPFPSAPPLFFSKLLTCH